MKNILFSKKELILNQKKTIEKEDEKVLFERYLKSCERMNLKYMSKEEINKVIEIQFKKIENCLQKTSIDDYAIWLNGFLDNGGMITHFYDYPFNFNYWFNIIDDCEWEIPLFGSRSCNFIILNGVEFKFNEYGHMNFYFMDGYKHIGGLVPFYNNMLNEKFKIRDIQ